MPPILRILALATVLSLAAAPGADAQTVRTGSLDSGDPTYSDGKRYDEYSIDVTAGREVIAILTAVDFDPYLVLVAPNGERFENDDYADSPDVSRVQEISSETTTWRVQVTSYETGESGNYALVLTTRLRTDATTSDEDFTVTGEIPPGATASVSGMLDESDKTRNDESWYEGWSIDVAEGDRVIFLLKSPDFDTYLSLVSPTDRLFNDDDGGGGTDSRLDMTFDEAGRWTVVANSLNPGDSGGYTLSVERQ